MQELKIFDTLLEPVFAIDNSNKIIYCNEVGANLCGLSIRKVTKQSMKDIFTFSPETPPAIENIQSIYEATPYKELYFQSTGGLSGKVQITFQPLIENQVWVAFVRDVTLEETLQKKYKMQLDQKEEVIEQLKVAQKSLENYSKNLEKMVEERTQELNSLNTTLTALVNSLGEGFFIFQENGLCLEIYSKACEQLLETIPAKKYLWDVLKIQTDEIENLKNWIKTLFLEPLPFTDLTPLGPEKFSHSKSKDIKLEYYPIRDHNNKIDSVVVVASDITDLITAQKEAEFERSFASMILKILKNKSTFKIFWQESQNILNEIEYLLRTNPDREIIFRHLHTIKGGSSSFSLFEITQATHQSEELLTDSPDWAQFKISFQKIKSLFDKFANEQLLILDPHLLETDRIIEIPLPSLANSIINLEKLSIPSVSSSLLPIKNLISVPIGSYFTYLDDTLSLLADKLGKKIAPIEFTNFSLKIIPEYYFDLFSSLIHSFRNSIDHGIETPEERLNLGKNEAGKISLLFSEDNKNLIITIKDDGRGINPEAIRNKLQKLGISSAHESDAQVIFHIFDNDFSTKEEVTDLSGRGVGMGAIKSLVENKYKGSCVLQSRIGEGTSLTIKVPWKNNISELI